MNQPIKRRRTEAKEQTAKQGNTKKEMPGIFSGVSGKILQYLMLVMLLVLVFVVSAYAGRMKKAKNDGKVADGTKGVETAEDKSGNTAGGVGLSGAGDDRP